MRTSASRRFGSALRLLAARPVDAYVSAAMRPYLLAALIAASDEARRGRCWSSPPTTVPPAIWPAT